jgi:hypothetical protein
MTGARSSLITSLAVMTTAYYTSAPPPRLALCDLAQPAALDAQEAALPEVQALARRFNPAMALPIPTSGRWRCATPGTTVAI